jgi:hypothetical protein
VRTRLGGKDVNEEVATEMLLLRPDGKLVVKSSLETAADETHKEIVGKWEGWLKEVMARKEKSGDEGNGFSPRAPGGMNPP